MLASGKNVTVNASAKAARGNAKPTAAAAIVSPTGQPAG